MALNLLVQFLKINMDTIKLISPVFYEDDVKKINNIVTKDVILLVNKIKKYVINYNFTKEKTVSYFM